MANKQKNNNKRTIHTHKGKKQAETLRTTAGTEDLCIHLQNHLQLLTNFNTHLP